MIFWNTETPWGLPTIYYPAMHTNLPLSQAEEARIPLNSLGFGPIETMPNGTRRLMAMFLPTHSSERFPNASFAWMYRLETPPPAA